MQTLRVVRARLLEPLDGLVHGFERRLGPPGWETPESARRRVAAALSADGRLLLLKQVHGAVVHEAPWDGRPVGDAALATTSGWLLGIETADCLPVLVVDPRRRLAGAAHAGWRGTAAGVTARLVEALLARGAQASDLLAVLGPSIGPCCYEVGEELRQAFGPEGEAFFRPGPRGRPHLDLRAPNRRQLEAAGLRPGQIEDLDECTYCRADQYHSFRREGAGAGRQISFVGWRSAPAAG